MIALSGMSFDYVIEIAYIDNEEACDCGHMTCHMMRGHKSRL